jgi:signal transduction histidine kinase
MTAAPQTPPDVRTARALLWPALASVALCAVTVAYAYAASAPDVRWQTAASRAALVVIPSVVALVQLRRRPGDRFARLLLLVTPAAALTTLAVSDRAVPYSIGRTAVWVVEVALVYLLLAYPSGRVTATADRVTVAAAAVLALTLYLPTALVVEHFPEPTPWGTCGSACPHNALALTATEPAIVESLIRPVREAATAALFLVVCGLIALRTWRAVPLGRWALAPVLATATMRAVTLAVYDLLRQREVDGPAFDALGTAFVLSLPLVAVGFAAGLIGARLGGASALERITRRATAGPGAGTARDDLADALGDPAIRVAYRARPAAGGPGVWVDETGWPLEPLTPGPARAVTEVSAAGREIAFEHDAMLLLEPGVLEGAAAYALAIVENQRLVEEAERRLRELEASRARILMAGDHARHQIERDLHDGAQQRLVAVRTTLALEAVRLGGTDDAVGALLARLGDEVELTIDEVRAIAHGLYPSLLAERGVTEALRSAARTAPITTRIEAEGVGRYSPEIETTVYLVCLEALQNAVKHAKGATRVTISLVDDGRLRFTVVDDGPGFEPAAVTSGSGLVNLHDRAAALGGVIAVESSPGTGTRVAGAVPLERPPLTTAEEAYAW